MVLHYDSTMANFSNDSSFNNSLINAELEGSSASQTHFPSPVQITYYAIGFLGVFNNGIVIYVIFRSANMLKKITNLFIVNQSVVDFVTCIMVVLCNLPYQLVDNGLSMFICKVFVTQYAMFSCLFTSALSLVLITFERFFMVVKPIMHRNWFTRKMALVSIAIVWITVPFIAIWAVLVVSFEQGECMPFSVWHSEAMRAAFGTVYFLITTLTPMASMGIAYLTIFKTIRKRNKIHASTTTAIEQQQSNTVQTLSKREFNLLTTAVIVFACFCVCYIPEVIVILLYASGYQGVDLSQNELLSEVPFFLLYIACFINPFVYTFNYEIFKKEFNKYVCCNKIKTAGFHTHTSH